MTYVIGLHRQGITAIIADMRGSSTDGKLGENTCLKAGILFSGCIFGASGHAGNVIEFLDRAREVVEAASAELCEQWQVFIEFAERYHAPCGADDAFSLLIASRATGTSRLFRYDSCLVENRLQDAGRFAAIGSGTLALNEFIKRVDEAVGNCDLGEGPSRCLPAMYALALTGRANGYQRAALESVGVGGAFYYVYQTNQTEDFQPPTVFGICFSDDGGDTIAVCRVQVAFVGRALGVRWLPNVLILAKSSETVKVPSGVRAIYRGDTQHLYAFGGFSRDFPRLLEPGQNKMAEWMLQLDREFSAIDNFEFCGLTFAGITECNWLIGQIRTRIDEPYKLNPTTREISEDWKHAILHQYRNRVRLPSEDRETSYFLTGELDEILCVKLGYNSKLVAQAAVDPDQSVNVTDRHTRRLKWFEDGTGVLVFGTLNLENTIQIDFGLPLAFDLPDRTVGFATPLSEVVDAFVESFCPLLHLDDGSAHRIYSGPQTRLKFRWEDYTGGEALGFGHGSSDTYFDFFLCIDIGAYQSWYYEHVYTKLPCSAKA